MILRRFILIMTLTNPFDETIFFQDVPRSVERPRLIFATVWGFVILKLVRKDILKTYLFITIVKIATAIEEFGSGQALHCSLRAAETNLLCSVVGWMHQVWIALSVSFVLLYALGEMQRTAAVIYPAKLSFTRPKPTMMSECCSSGMFAKSARGKHDQGNLREFWICNFSIQALGPAIPSQRKHQQLSTHFHSNGSFQLLHNLWNSSKSLLGQGQAVGNFLRQTLTCLPCITGEHISHS